jgi:hypothetical protein
MSVRPKAFALLATLSAAIAVVAGCATDNTNEPAAKSGTPAPTSQAAPTTGAYAHGKITDAAAKDLCARLERTLSDWRVQTPTLGKGGLNILVQEWAAVNGGLNAEILMDRSVIDKVTIDNCADTRDQAIKALEIPDFAAGLVGL